MRVPRDVDELDKAAARADIDYSLEHPRVVHTPDRLERARANAHGSDWGRRIRDRVTEVADRVPQGLAGLMIDAEPPPLVDLSPEQIRALAPITDDGEWYGCYAAAFDSTPANLARHSVSPIDGSRLRLAGLDRPGELVDGAGRTFPGTHDGIAVTLDPDGWQVPDDVPATWAASEYAGERFCLAAVYNGAVVRLLYACVEPLAYAYALTEDPEYAETAAVAFDVLAAASPGSKGVLGRENGYIPHSGWLHRVGYTAGRALRAMARAADLLWNSAAFDASPVTTLAGMGGSNHHETVRRRVAEDLFVEGMHYLWEDVHGGAGEYEKTVYAELFNNGTADYCEGILAAASLLGVETGYAAWTLDGQVSLDKFLANTTFRDGQYYETSGNYGNENFAPFARMAQTYRSSAYPNGKDVFDTDRYERVMLSGPARRQVAGRVPAYGDTTGGGDYPPQDADFGVISGPPTGNWGWAFLYWCRASGTRREHAAEVLAAIAGGDPMVEIRDRAREFSYSGVDGGTRPLFFIEGGIDVPEPRDDRIGDDLLPGKGMALQRPDGDQDRGTFLRYGPTLNHGHADEFGLQFYGGGRELSNDPGRRPKLHVLGSWFEQTVAHNTVVIDETPSGRPENAGADVLGFADRPGYGFVEVTNDALYDAMDEYRRGVAYIDVDAESYIVDLFRLTGGDVRDYSFHGGGTEFDTDLTLDDPEPGSLASADYWWGDKVDETGVIEGFEQEERWFNAPPGNGYGFLGRPRSAPGEEAWSARWSVAQEPSATVRLTMLGDGDREIVVADAPEVMVDKLVGDPETDDSLQYTLARDRSDGPTQFVSLIEPAGENPPVEDVAELATESDASANAGGRSPVALALTVGPERVDYICSAPDQVPLTATLPNGGTLRTDAAFAHVHVANNELQAVRIERASTFRITGSSASDVSVTLGETPTGRIQDLDEETSTLHVSGDIPADADLAGEHVLVDAPAYGRNAPFEIANVTQTTDETVRIDLAPTTFELGRGLVDEREGETLVSPTEFPFAHTQPQYAPAKPPNAAFDGKRVTNPDSDAATTIRDVRGDWNRIVVDDASAFEPGDQFVVHEVQRGDHVRIPRTFALTRSDGDVTWSATTLASVELDGDA